MKEKLYDYLVGQSGTLSAMQIVISFAAAIIIGMVIFISYKFSHTNTVYSAKFNVSLIMMTLITTLVMGVISNNVALSLGMVGALSIVRFRTAIKDSRDTAYIFWAIAAGVCCGVQDFLVVAIGSAVIFVVMMILGNVKNNDRFLIIVRGKCDSEIIAEKISHYFYGKASLRVDNSTKESMELIFEVSETVIRKAKERNGGKDIKSFIFELDNAGDIETVNIVCQNDEITR